MMEKQVLDLDNGKEIAVEDRNNRQRRWRDLLWRNVIISGTYDRRMETLNFEFVAGCKIQAVDKRKSFAEKFRENLQTRGVKDPNDRLDLEKNPKYCSVINILSGRTRMKMRELALGHQEIKWKKTRVTIPSSGSRRSRNGRRICFASRQRSSARRTSSGSMSTWTKRPLIHCTIIPV